MAGMTLRYYNLTGGLNTIQGLGTLNQSPKKTETPSCFNVEPFKLSGIKTMGGNRKKGATLTATVSLGCEYVKGSNKYLMVCTIDGKIWEYNPATNSFNNIYQFPNSTPRFSAVNYNQGIVFSNGVDDLVYYQKGRHELVEGSVTITDGSTTVTGVGTHFTKLSPGDHILFEGINQEYVIASITSDTELEMTEEFELTSPSTDYYAWTYDEETLFTTVVTNGLTSVQVYVYDDGEMVLQDYTGNIEDGKLVLTETRYVERTYYYNCYQYTSSKAPTSSWSVQPRTGYLYARSTWENYDPIYANSTHSTETQSENLDVFKVTVHIASGQSGNTQTIDGEYPVYIAKVGTATYPSVYILDPANPTNYINIGSLQPSSTHNFSETVTEEETIVTKYTRDQSSDTHIGVVTTGTSMYLAPISELNAIYINSDDNTVHNEIRGLALNTWQGRLFVGGNDGILYYSEVGSIHGWDLKYGAGAIPMFYNDNSKFTALGIYGQYLVIHRKDYTYYLVPGLDSTPDSWQLVPFADLSCDSQQSWLSLGNAYYIYSRMHQGIYPLMKRTSFIENYMGDEISQKVTDSFELINTSAYDKIFPVYEPLKNFIMFYIPMLSGKGSNYCFCYDTITKSWWLRIVPQTVTCAFRFDNKVYIGTAGGEVLEEFAGNTFNGEPIKFSYRTPWFYFGDGTNYLSTREFRVKLDGEFTNNFYVRNRRDGREDYKERYVTDKKGAVDALIWDMDSNDTTLTDTVWDDFDWAQVLHLVKRFPLADQFFQSEQIEFCGEGLSEGMAIIGFEMDRAELEEVPW